MSADHSNTHQGLSPSFTGPRGGKMSRGSYSTTTSRQASSLDETAEFKALRVKYSASLKTLNEMFPDWSDADLLSALKETDGSLEMTIAHIAEGHVTQWGEVKSRKEKRQTPKQQQSSGDAKSFERSNSGSSHIPRPASFRGGVRGGAARSGRGSHASGSRGRSTPKASTSNTNDSGAWEVTSTTTITETTKPTSSGGRVRETKTTTSTTTTASRDKKPKNQTSSAGAASAPPKPAAMSWASIAKKGAKPVVPEPSKSSSAEPAAEQPLSAWDDPEYVASKELTGVEDNTVLVVEKTEQITTEIGNAPGSDQTPITSSVAKNEEVGNVAKTADNSFGSTAAIPDHQNATVLQEPKTAIPESKVENNTPLSVKKPVASNTRRLPQQEAPVVMPTSNASLERIGMQFGSLSIGGVDLGSLKPVAGAPVAATKPSTAEVAAGTKETAAVPVAVTKEEPAAAPVADSAAQGPLTTYLQQQQLAHNQSQTQSQASLSAISQMPLPNDYGAAALYGADAVQRNMMGFYDNYGYGQFVNNSNKDNTNANNPVTTAADSQTPSSTGVSQSVGINGGATGSNITQAGGLFPQQIPQPFGMNHGMPYYNPYYYNVMQPGSQFPNPAAYGNNPALAAAYGQPFMKQGMYPMYPGTAAPQGLQGIGSQQQEQPHHHTQQSQQQQQLQSQQQQQQQQQSGQSQQQQAGLKGQNNAANAYASINVQHKAGNPYGHYSTGIGGFSAYEQDPSMLSNSPQQFSGFGGIPGIFASSTKSGGNTSGGNKDSSSASKGGMPQPGVATGSAQPAMSGAVNYYSSLQQPQPHQPQQQQHSSHPQQQGYSQHQHHQQQAYYNPYAQSYGQAQNPQQMYHQHQPPQSSGSASHQHQQSGKQHWGKQ